MKKENKALLLALVASLSFLCGCSKKANTIETEDGTYVEQNGEYVKLNLEPVVFEPGTHVIKYVSLCDDVDGNWRIVDSYLKTGFDNPVKTPEVPEGYKLVGVTSYANNDGYDRYIIYIFVNEERVEAEGKYYPEINMVLYNTPGTIINEKSLELGD